MGEFTLLRLENLPDGTLSFLLVLLRKPVNDFRLRHHCSAGNPSTEGETYVVLAIE
jgi:hypothetical protein